MLQQVCTSLWHTNDLKAVLVWQLCPWWLSRSSSGLKTLASTNWEGCNPPINCSCCFTTCWLFRHSLPAHVGFNRVKSLHNDM